MEKTAAERTKEWRKNNPDKVKAYREKTKERRKELGVIQESELPDINQFLVI